ncbi:solute carrier family 20 (sodium-dependent phosphate transporter) [Angomonas deanei]|uniref:Phosphate transporter n=1 Tax=Angomonas deanei TaxID=59799 RepID=A0A7G2C6D2_9TRYP|nr:solute carrier family 20 (sodium-dependent phosphate transporter) [Angomonas deanei]CAD2215320.1 Phosphate transporter family, putative [Angomonas deanei]|eukprot:EPY30073.1 solute carrier family 20 (sodium-dependent phosphate transporter) [Angomonas deanei]
MIYPYLWIVVVGGFLAFATGAGVGMNDLSNAFGTTYGAKVLTLFQICVLASVCEFTGAVLLGGAVTSTISGGIASPENFRNYPYVFMYGMLCACGAAFVWLCLATWLVLPVSSTHSICGGVIGFALVFGGKDSVYWARRKDEFPYIGGVAPIVASWFISPVLTGLVSAGIYGLVRRYVLQPENSFERAIQTLPLIVSLTFFFEAFFVLYKGAGEKLQWGITKTVLVSAALACVVGLAVWFFLPMFKRKLESDGAVPPPVEEPAESGADSPAGSYDSPRKSADSTEASAVVVNRDSFAEAPASPTHASGMTVEIYGAAAEGVYRYLQVFTAVCASFAHGASDVSNAVGPFAAMYSVYQKGTVDLNKETPKWILALGGFGLIVGLSTFGCRLMRLLGEKLTVITPSRGFSAELSAALVVSFASGYGIPVSSTHCITGAVIAVSMLDVGAKNVRWGMVAKMYVGWVGTLFVTAFISATFFAQGIYAPIV